MPFRVVVVCLCVGLISATTKAQRAPVVNTLDGYWTNGTATPLERPKQFTDRFSLTSSEAAAFERDGIARLLSDIPESEHFAADLNDTYLETGGLRLIAGGRISLIVDPPDGRLPARVPAARERAAARPKYGYDDPETLGLTERCLAGNDGGASQLAAPIVPNSFGLNYYQIVQTTTHVLLHSEVMHETRIVRLGNRPHLPRHVGEWLGDSVGHWEGDTLVVDTTNLNGKIHFRGSGERMHVVERFTRRDQSTIWYRATVEDPETWVHAWTIEYPFTAINHRVVEFACHEANYSLANSLSGHRAEERRKQ
jgi:hypothetical protein